MLDEEGRKRLKEIRSKLNVPEGSSLILRTATRALLPLLIVQPPLLVIVARERDVPLWRAEQMILGYDHGTLGALLIHDWHLSEDLAHCSACSTNAFLKSS